MLELRLFHVVLIQDELQIFIFLVCQFLFIGAITVLYQKKSSVRLSGFQL